MTNLVEIRGLKIRFTGERTVYAVNDLSFSLGEGEVLGLLGESGSGKSVTLRALMRLLPKKRTQISGSIEVLGRDEKVTADDVFRLGVRAVRDGLVLAAQDHGVSFRDAPPILERRSAKGSKKDWHTEPRSHRGEE